MPGIPSGFLDAANKARGSLGPLAQALLDRVMPVDEITPSVGIAVGPVKAGGFLQRFLPRREPTVVQPRKLETFGESINYQNEFRPWAGVQKIKDLIMRPNAPVEAPSLERSLGLEDQMTRRSFLNRLGGGTERARESFSREVAPHRYAKAEEFMNQRGVGNEAKTADFVRNVHTAYDDANKTNPIFGVLKQLEDKMGRSTDWRGNSWDSQNRLNYFGESADPQKVTGWLSDRLHSLINRNR